LKTLQQVIIDVLIGSILMEFDYIETNVRDLLAVLWPTI